MVVASDQQPLLFAAYLEPLVDWIIINRFNTVSTKRTGIAAKIVFVEGTRIL